MVRTIINWSDRIEKKAAAGFVEWAVDCLFVIGALCAAVCIIDAIAGKSKK